MALSVIYCLDGDCMFCCIISHSAECTLGLLDLVGVGAGLLELDLAKALGLILVSLLDRDASVSWQRCAFVSTDREGELIIIRPVTACKSLLDLDLAGAFCCIGVCDLNRSIRFCISCFSCFRSFSLI